MVYWRRVRSDGAKSNKGATIAPFQYTVVGRISCAGKARLDDAA